MSDRLEVWQALAGPELFALDGDRVTVGTSGSVDLRLSDRAVSRLHATMDRVGERWTLRDLGSRNGTTVNGERIFGERVLHDGDEIRAGAARLIFRAGDGTHTGLTEAAEAAPGLTPRERDVLIELCRPVLAGSLITEPSSVGDIAKVLVLTESAVKKHLANLYDKFGLRSAEERRRGRLANDAITRGAVTLGELRESRR